MPQTRSVIAHKASHLSNKLDSSKRASILLFLIYQMRKLRPSQHLNSDWGSFFALPNPNPVPFPLCQATSLKTKIVVRSFIVPKD